MKARVLGLLCLLAVLALLISLALRSQNVLERGLPPLVICADLADAQGKAGAFAATHGGSVFSVGGTGSMAPYIPAGRNAADVVAFGVTRAGATFADVKAGALCLYADAASPVGVTLHSAALRTKWGWVMSGLHNARSDARMTAETFRGIVAQVFTWRQ